MPLCLPRAFFRRDPVTVARRLLGQTFVRVFDGVRLAGVIVETEAYLGIPDAAAHTFGGRRTKRVTSMWADGGRLYVYFTYGMHHCMNIVAGVEGDPVAVLVRAIEPTEGLEVMRRLRGTERDTNLCSGPGKVCAAFAVGRDLDGIDLTASDAAWIEQARRRALPENRIAVTPRIGVAYAGEWAARPLRFFIKGNPHVSRPSL